MATETVAPASLSISPLRKRGRAELSQRRHKTKLSSPPPRRLRMRIDRNDRIWAGRCGCKSPNCMADEFEFATGSSASCTSDSSDSDGDWGGGEDGGGGGDSDGGHEEDCEDKSFMNESRLQPPPAKEKEGKDVITRPAQDPDDLVPMLLHLMLMM